MWVQGKLAACPFAGITRIRFKGWLDGSSPISAGCRRPPSDNGADYSARLMAASVAAAVFVAGCRRRGAWIGRDSAYQDDEAGVPLRSEKTDGPSVAMASA